MGTVGPLERGASAPLWGRGGDQSYRGPCTLPQPRIRDAGQTENPNTREVGVPGKSAFLVALCDSGSLYSKKVFSAANRTSHCCSVG